MKGTLIKTDGGWQVLFVYREDNHFSPHWSNQLPLHPEESKCWHNQDIEFYNGKEAEFEIVTEDKQRFARFFHKFTNELNFVSSKKKAKTKK